MHTAVERVTFASGTLDGQARQARLRSPSPHPVVTHPPREFFLDNLLARIHFIIVVIW